MSRIFRYYIGMNFSNPQETSSPLIKFLNKILVENWFDYRNIRYFDIKDLHDQDAIDLMNEYGLDPSLANTFFEWITEQQDDLSLLYLRRVDDYLWHNEILSFKEFSFNPSDMSHCKNGLSLEDLDIAYKKLKGAWYFAESTMPDDLLEHVRHYNLISFLNMGEA